MALTLKFSDHDREAGVDEAGRGCLAGPVVAAAVILPSDFSHPMLTDSKKLSHAQRMELRPIIIEQALAWGIGSIGPKRIDRVNILNATYEAMHQAIGKISPLPGYLSIDGNRFRPFPEIQHSCIIKGDGKFLNIAAASILAKTERDLLMVELGKVFPVYQWKSNKGYPTRAHKEAIRDHGPSIHHRKTFNWQIPPTLFDDIEG